MHVNWASVHWTFLTLGCNNGKEPISFDVAAWKRFRFADNTLNKSQDLWFLKWANHNQLSKGVDCGRKEDDREAGRKWTKWKKKEEDKSKYARKLKQKGFFFYWIRLLEKWRGRGDLSAHWSFFYVLTVQDFFGDCNPEERF